MMIGGTILTDWTPSRVRNFIISVLRQGTRRWPNKYECLNEAKAGKKINKKTGRLAEHYICNQCKKPFPAKEVQVDHINPVIEPKEGFVDWNTYIERLYCGKENLQVLCSKCHDIKSTREKKERKK